MALWSANRNGARSGSPRELPEGEINRVRSVHGRGAPWRRGALAVAASFFAFLLLPGGSQAQAQANSPACRNLAAQINALGRTAPRGTARYAQAAARQERELARTAAFAEQRGCNRRQFLFFGSPPPPQCAAVNARIAQMRANLASLQARVHNAHAGVESQRRALTARYNAMCRPQVAALPHREPGFFERLFGGGHEPQMREIPVEPDEPREQEYEPGPRGGPKAVCVRTCDGGFFPVSYSARRGNLDALSELCTALCPNAETRLYTMIPSREIDDAISADGEAYTDLPNAGRFKTSYNPSCSCKRPGETWAEVLRKAEDLLVKNSRDVIVDDKKSAELSKPKVAAAEKQKRNKRALEDEKEAERQGRELEAEGKRAAAEAERMGAGIDPGRQSHKRIYSVRDGTETEITGPDGVRRKVRIIAPQL